MKIRVWGECQFGLPFGAATVKYIYIYPKICEFCLLYKYKLVFDFDRYDVHIFNLHHAELPKVQKRTNARLPLCNATDYEALLLKFIETEILS